MTDLVPYLPIPEFLKAMHQNPDTDNNSTGSERVAQSRLRIKTFVKSLEKIIPSILEECVIEDNILMLRDFYADKIVDNMKKHLNYLLEVRIIYVWLGLTTEVFHSGGKYAGMKFDAFINLYELEDGGKTILTKLANDLMPLWKEYKNNPYNQDFIEGEFFCS